MELPSFGGIPSKRARKFSSGGQKIGFFRFTQINRADIYWVNGTPNNCLLFS
jgi:hypothetical protein